MKSQQAAASESLKLCCRVLEEKKAGELLVLNVSEQSSITDYLIVATATSLPHLRALRVELEKALDAANTHIVGMETPHGSDWMVIDAFDIMIHLFLADARERYGLERLWRDATEVSVAKLLAEPKAKVKRSKPKAAAPVKPPRKSR
jgi:ribosome-associated protein